MGAIVPSDMETSPGVVAGAVVAGHLRQPQDDDGSVALALLNQRLG